MHISSWSSNQKKYSQLNIKLLTSVIIVRNIRRVIGRLLTPAPLCYNSSLIRPTILVFQCIWKTKKQTRRPKMESHLNKSSRWHVVDVTKKQYYIHPYMLCMLWLQPISSIIFCVFFKSKYAFWQWEERPFQRQLHNIWKQHGMLRAWFIFFHPFSQWNLD